MLVQGVIVAALAMGGCAAAQSREAAGVPPKEPAPASPAATPAAGQSNAAKTPRAPVAGFEDADALLRALETADTDLRTLSSELLWIKEFFLGGDTHTRMCKLFFVDERVPANAVPKAPANDPARKGAAGKAEDENHVQAGKRKFAVKIESVAMANKGGNQQRVVRDVQEFIFDGAALVERFPAEKRLVRHQLGRAGSDPLKIGEGPIPLPVGQKREDILARFTVELLPAEQGLVPEGSDPNDPEVQQLLGLVKGSAQLKLIPKPEFERECAFKEARLWYRRSAVPAENGRLLPRMARAVNKQDDVDTVVLVDVVVNAPVNEVFNAAVPEGWQEQVIGAGN